MRTPFMKDKGAYYSWKKMSYFIFLNYVSLKIQNFKIKPIDAFINIITVTHFDFV